MSAHTLHWTEGSTTDFLYRVASDFMEQLQDRMETLGWSQTKLAKEAKVNKSYVSQVFKKPGNLTLETIIKFSRVLGMKATVVAYDDGDEKNARGPVNSEVFRLCWEHAKKPADMWSFKETTQVVPATKELFYYVPRGRHGWQQSGKVVGSKAVGQVTPRRGYANPHLESLRMKNERETSSSQLISEIIPRW